MVKNDEVIVNVTGGLISEQIEELKEMKDVLMELPEILAKDKMEDVYPQLRLTLELPGTFEQLSLL